jgi:hypothetical protein
LTLNTMFILQDVITFWVSSRVICHSWGLGFICSWVTPILQFSSERHLDRRSRDEGRLFLHVFSWS